MADQEKEILEEEMEQDLSDAEELKEEETEDEEPVSKEDKKAAKKQAKLNKKEDSYKEKIDQLEDRVKRQMAEFENFRKRTDKEKQAMFDTGAKSVIEKILPVVDNFERGLATVPEESKEDPFVDGMNRIYKQLITELENIGVKPIEAVGQEFDPNLHNAVMQVESDEYESGVVAQELPVFQRPAGHCVVAFVHAAQHLLPILPDRFPGVAGDGDLLLGAFVGG